VRFVLPGEENKRVGKVWKKERSGFCFPGTEPNAHFRSMRDVPYGRRVFTARYIVQCWMEHYRENQTWEVYRNLKYWYDFGTGWGWNEEILLDEARFKVKSSWSLPSGGCISGCFCQKPTFR